MRNTLISKLKNRIEQAKVPLEDFPWLLAIVLYTLSWGWSLIRPNTLYWDDWAYIYNKPKSYLNQIFVNTGLPPWRALIDQELIAIGYWTIPLLTFLLFFGSGLVLFTIIRKINFIDAHRANIIVLIFLIAPVNHARIALVMFGYSTSYFLFFLAWAILIRHEKNSSFLLALILFFWSFMTHSFLFFYLLPLAHYLYINISKLKNQSLRKFLTLKILTLGSIPFVYFVLRNFFWPPTEDYEHYHKFAIDGARLGIIFFVLGGIITSAFVYFFKGRGALEDTSTLPIIGWLIFAWALYPYFVNQNFGDVISVFAFRSDWGSRHLLLTPLGIGLLCAGLLAHMPRFLKKSFTVGILLICVSVNIFLGSQYFLDSLKKNQLEELFKNSETFDENANIIFIDEKKIFNGRFSTYRNSELSALIAFANKDVKSISGKSSCNDVSNGLVIRLKSDETFYSALLSRDLGLYLEISPC